MQVHAPGASPAPRRILVRGANWLGDAVMTTPALLRLRERFPQAHLALLTPEKLHGLWLEHPAVNEVVPFTAGEGLFSVSRKLGRKQFDLALVLPNSPRAALEAWLARIPRRLGAAAPWRNWLLTEVMPPRPDAVKMRKLSAGRIARLNENSSPRPPQELPITAHQIHHYLHLVAALGANPEPLPPRLLVEPPESDAVARKFGLLDALTSARPVFGLNPGAEYGPAKRWPVDRFISAAREIQERTNCLWLVFGGGADRALAQQIASALRSPHPAPLDLAGRTSLRELMALLKVCRVLLTNDSGPMHVAAALGTPVVVPFGSTSAALTGPGLPGDPRHRLLRSSVPCSPCIRRVCPIDFRCMTGISVERVVAAVLQIVS
jgi:heptosyltransferase-2